MGDGRASEAGGSWVAAAADAGERLDRAVSAWAGVSVHAARRLLAAGLVEWNGRRAGESDKGRRLAAGDAVAVRAGGGDVVPEPGAALRVLAEGEGWVAVDKPAGAAVHPLRPGETGTVLNAVAARYPSVLGLGEGGLRSGVVHRLDVETSGVLVFATDERAWRELREAFAGHAVHKAYHAIVRGRLTGEGREAVDLAVTRHRPARVGVVAPGEPGARRCTLSWRSLASGEAASLVEVDLETGFLHQVRVTFAHLGHAVLGDAVYGERGNWPRTLLHARRLAWRDVEASADWPADFAEAARALGLADGR